MPYQDLLCCQMSDRVQEVLDRNPGHARNLLQNSIRTGDLHHLRNQKNEHQKDFSRRYGI